MVFVHGEQPFWFWNGEVTKQEVRRQILSMKEGGAKGFFLHPRQGLKLPYMTNHFLDMVKCAVLTAKEAGMEMWLYDEYPYPSGVSGGEILENPDFRAHFLKPYVFEGSGLFKEQLRWGTVLYAKAFPVQDGKVDWAHPVDVTHDVGIIYLREVFQGGTGLSAYNRKRYFTGEHAKQFYWEAPQGQWKVFIFLDHEMDDFKYFGCFVDPLNKDAIRAYIQTTHERYKQAFGEEFGKTVKGIFTDETAPMGGYGILWSKLLPRLFEARNGYSLLDKLPALLQDMDGVDTEKFLYDYNATVYEAFVESYDKPIRAWCDENGLIFTGEKPHLRAEQCGNMTIAGIDNGHVKCGAVPTRFQSHYRSNAKTVASSNHFLGDNVTLCEAYHSLGWDATLRDMRWMVDWMGVDGVNLFVPHAFYYSEDALRKHDASPSFFENMPWWRYNSLFTRHLETTTTVTQYGKRRARVLVLDPIFQNWTQRGPQQPRGVQTPMVRVQQALAGRYVDYYVIDRNLMARASFEDGQVVLNGERFSAVVLPGMRLVEPESRAFLTQAQQNGVKLFALDCLPERCITDGRSFALQEGVAVQTDAVQLAGQIADWVDSPLRIQVQDADALKKSFVTDTIHAQLSSPIAASVFDLDGVTYVYSVNLGKEMLNCELTLQAGPDEVALVDTVTGEAEALDSQRCGDKVCWQYAYAPFAPALFAVGKTGAPAAKPQRAVTVDPAMTLPMKAEQENLLRLGVWQGDFGLTKGEVTPMPVIDQLVSLSGSIPIREKSGFGCTKKLQFPQMDLAYETSFDLQIDCPLTFAMEPGAVLGAGKIFVNGTEITGLLAPRRVYARENLACDITPYVRPGKNTVRVTVQAQMDHDGLVNALYIAGNFGCWKENGVWTLRAPAETGAMNDLPACGLPFYCGQLSYDVSALVRGEGLTAVSIDDWTYENACELFMDGVSCGAKAWNPYRWLVKPGETAQIQMATTLLGAYEGSRFDVARHETLDVQ